MALMPKRKPVHTGRERYEIELGYSDGEVDMIRSLTRPGQVVVDTVILVWEREVGGEWKRVTSGIDGSRVTGQRRLDPSAEEMGSRGPRGVRSIFSRDVGEIMRLADLLPGLRDAIEASEAHLPE